MFEPGSRRQRQSTLGIRTRAISQVRGPSSVLQQNFSTPEEVAAEQTGRIFRDTGDAQLKEESRDKFNVIRASVRKHLEGTLNIRAGFITRLTPMAREWKLKTNEFWIKAKKV